GVESCRCEVEAAGINYHITVSARPHPLKIWSRPDDLLLDAAGDPAAPAPPPVSRSSRCRLVLRNVSCRARPGELLAIVGPSGAGKSTLLEILSGRLEPSSSNPTDLRVNGSPVDAAALRRLCGYVTQRDVLFPLLTVRETLHFSARLRLGPDEYDPNAVDALVDDLALARVADARVKDLSGGERRRVSIGVEAVRDPAVLVLDEPTSGLDSASALQIVGALRAMAESRGRTVVLSIHQPGARIVKMFDAVLLLAAGSVLHHGSVDELHTLLAGAGLRLPPHVDAVEFAIDSVDELRLHLHLQQQQRDRRCTLQQLFQQHKLQQWATPVRQLVAARGGGAVAALLQERGADAAALRVPHRVHARRRPRPRLHLLRSRRRQGGGAGGPLRVPPHLPAVIDDGGAAGVFAGAGDPCQGDVVGGLPRVRLRRGERPGVPAIPAGSGGSVRGAGVLADGAAPHSTGLLLLPPPHLAGPLHGQLGGGVLRGGGAGLRGGERGGAGRDGLLLPLLGLLHPAVGDAGVLGADALSLALQVAVRGAAAERVRGQVRGDGDGGVRGDRRRGAPAGGHRGGVPVAERGRHGRLRRLLPAARLRRAPGPLQPHAQGRSAVRIAVFLLHISSNM
uniref:ABC transporter domain-containing protein n=1 Tax=Aegilops tauschii subsp. strangulata TaxID=200361 RepID=A0A453DJN2_AEGTS